MGACRSQRKDALEKTLRLLSIEDAVDLNRGDRGKWRRIYADLMRRGEEVELNESLIAATPLSLGIKGYKRSRAFQQDGGYQSCNPRRAGVLVAMLSCMK